MGTGAWRGGSGGASPSGSRTGGGISVTRALSREHRDATLLEAGRAVAQLCARRNMGGYLGKLVASPALQVSYGELFTLKELLQQSSWDAVAHTYEAPDGPGCLRNVALAIRKKSELEEPNETFRDIASTAVESFLLEALRHDVSALMNGNAAAVKRKLDPRVFERISGYFFGGIVYEMALKELEAALPPGSYVRLEEAARQRADYVINKFENRFYPKGQVTYRDFLKLCAENPDWFVERMREPIT